MGSEGAPLLTLAAKLLSRGPPSLSALIAQLEDVEEYQNFVTLVKEFLPEEESTILRQTTPQSQIAAFASHFETRYFPLQDVCRGMMESYREFTSTIPVVVMGMGWEDYHDIPNSWRLGFQLLTYLLEGPDEDEEDGARVALAEACAEHVPQEILERVPEGGLRRGEAHRLLEGSSYEALAVWGDILAGETENFFLDTPSEFLYDGYDGLPSWERGAVEQLTREWQQADLMWQRVLKLAEWLEDKPAAHMGELLDFLEERRDGDERH